MKPISCILALIAICSGVLPAQAAPANPRSEIQASLDAMDKALVNKDSANLMKGLAPDYIEKELDGTTRTYQQQYDEIPAVLANVKCYNAKSTILIFSIKATKVYLTARQRYFATATNIQTHKTSTMVVTDTDSEVWSKVGGQWMEESSQDISQNTQPVSANTVDGH